MSLFNIFHLLSLYSESGGAKIGKDFIIPSLTPGRFLRVDAPTSVSWPKGTRQTVEPKPVPFHGVGAKKGATLKGREGRGEHEFNDWVTEHEPKNLWFSPLVLKNLKHSQIFEEPSL